MHDLRKSADNHSVASLCATDKNVCATYCAPLWLEGECPHEPQWRANYTQLEGEAELSRQDVTMFQKKSVNSRNFSLHIPC